MKWGVSVTIAQSVWPLVTLKLLKPAQLPKL